MRRTSTLIATAAFAALAWSPVSAQTAGTPTTDVPYAAPADDDDDDFPWGLLGLLGLAGLLGRKRNDRIEVDNRTRP